MKRKIDKASWWMEATAACPPSLSAEKQHEAIIAEWAKSLPDDQRRVVESLPRLSCEPHAVGLEKDAAQWDEASETPDMAGVIDMEHELLMERFKLNEDQAISVMLWAKDREHNATRAVQARVIGVILAEFLGSTEKDLLPIVWGLAFQSGLAKGLTHKNPSQVSKDIGTSRAIISYHQKIFEDRLGLHDLTFSKTPEARKKYREARVAYVQKQKAKA